MKWWVKFKRRRRGQCVDCGEPFTLRQLDRCEYREEVTEEVVYKVVVSGMPCLGCTNPSHRKRLARPKWAEELIEAFNSTDTFPVSRWERFKLGKCCQCGVSLKKQKPVIRRVEGELQLEGVPSFHLQAQGHCVRCGDCGTWQMDHSSAMPETMASMIESAARAANIRG